MKTILISIRPEWVAKILNGEKTVEIRKSIPKCDLPIDVYIYCTKDKKYANLINRGGFLTGMVVAKFTLNEITKFDFVFYSDRQVGSYVHDDNTEIEIKKTCLGLQELFDYIQFGSGYEWHIDNLEIFDVPKELSDFKVKHYPQFAGFVKNTTHYELQTLIKAPQSWRYVEI